MLKRRGESSDLPRLSHSGPAMRLSWATLTPWWWWGRCRGVWHWHRRWWEWHRAEGEAEEEEEVGPGGEGVGVLLPARWYPHNPAPPGMLQGAEHFLVTGLKDEGGRGADILRTGVWELLVDWGEGILSAGDWAEQEEAVFGLRGEAPSEACTNTSLEGLARALSGLTVMVGDRVVRGGEFKGWSGETEGGVAGEGEEDWGCAGDDFCLQYWPGEGGSPSGMLLLLPNLWWSCTLHKTS